MVILDEGVLRFRDLVVADIDKGELGTDGTAVSSSDTDLIAADATTLLVFDSKTKSGASAKFDFVLPSTGGTSTTYKEYKHNSSGSSTDYDRIVFTGQAFTSGGNEDLNISKLYTFLGS